MPRATREPGPPLTRIDAETTAADVAEAMAWLNAEAKVEYDEWQRLLALNYISAATSHKARWQSKHAHLDDKLEVWQVLTALEASA